MTFSERTKNYRLRRRFASSWVASQTCPGFQTEKGNLFDFWRVETLFFFTIWWAPLFFDFMCLERIFSTLILMLYEIWVEDELVRLDGSPWDYPAKRRRLLTSCSVLIAKSLSAWEAKRNCEIGNCRHLRLTSKSVGFHPCNWIDLKIELELIKIKLLDW